MYGLGAADQGGYGSDKRLGTKTPYSLRFGLFGPPLTADLRLLAVSIVHKRIIMMQGRGEDLSGFKIELKIPAGIDIAEVCRKAVDLAKFA
jgi:hypothetical protein